MKSTILGLAFITAAFVAPSTGWGESPPAATATVPAKTNCPKVHETRTAGKPPESDDKKAPALAPAAGAKK